MKLPKCVGTVRGCNMCSAFGEPNTVMKQIPVMRDDEHILGRLIKTR